MDGERATLHRAENLDNLLVFSASYQKFQFSKHAHEDFALGMMERGIQKFHCRGEEFYAQPGSLITVNAGDVHDGMSANGDPYHYRIIYIPIDLLETVGNEMAIAKVPLYFQKSVTKDKELALQFRLIFQLLDQENIDMLEIQSNFYSMIADLLMKHGTMTTSPYTDIDIPDAVALACIYINDMACEHITLDDISTAAGLSRYHFLRLFNSSIGLTPYSYLLQRRLQVAKDEIRKGSSLADTAFATCFSEQSHFCRRFKAAFGITPRQYQKAVCQK